MSEKNRDNKNRWRNVTIQEVSEDLIQEYL